MECRKVQTMCGMYSTDGIETPWDVPSIFLQYKWQGHLKRWSPLRYYAAVWCTSTIKYFCFCIIFFCVLYFVCIFNFIQIYHNMLLQWFIYKKKVFFFISLLNLYFFLSHYFPLISEIISTYLFAFLYFIEYWINSLNWVLNWIWMGGYGRYSFHMYTITVCNQ